MQHRFPQCTWYSRAVVLIAAALPAGALQAQTELSTSYVTPAARAEQAALCPAGTGFPAQWTWDPAQTTAKPRAATPADNLTPRIEQYRAGRLIAAWPSLGSNPATCDFGNPDAMHPVNLTAAAASGCGPFGNYSHVDLWNIMEDGDQFLVAPAVYTGPTNNIVLSDKPRYWTGPMNKPTNIVIRGVTKNGVRPLIYRNDGGQGDYATAQGAVYFASATNVTMQNIDIAAGPNGSVGKAGIYINTAANLTLQDMRIHEFAWQANGADGQNGVFSTENVTGFITLSQIEAFNNGGPNGPTPNGQGQGTKKAPPGLPKWSIALLVLVVVGALVATKFWPAPASERLKLSEFLTQVDNGTVKQITIDNSSRVVTGMFKDVNGAAGGDFSTTSDTQINDSVIARFDKAGIIYDFKAPDNNWWAGLLTLLLPFALIIGFLIWMQRRACSTYKPRCLRAPVRN